MRIEGMEVLNDADFEEAMKAKALRMMLALKMSNEAVARYAETVKEDIAFVRAGKRPDAIVAARIYRIGLLCRESRTQEKIFIETGVSPTTIRLYFHEMQKGRNLNARNRANSDS